MRLGVTIIIACALVLAGGGALAATPKRAVFTVTLAATLTKDWTVTRTAEGECDRTTGSTGHWKLTLRSTRPTRLVAIGPRRRGGRVRFGRGLVRSLAGRAQQTGSRTVVSRGPSCVLERRDCRGQRRSFRGAVARLASPARGKVRFGRIQRASAARSFRRDCPQEPGDVRSIRTDLSLADGPLSTGDVFDRNVPRFFVSGNTEQVTTIEGDLDGTVTERVRWTLSFTRVGR
jgi:hypothetical protein